MDNGVDKISQSIESLENILENFKQKIQEYKDFQASSADSEEKTFKFPFDQLWQAAREFKTLKRSLKRTFKHSEHSRHTGIQEFSFDFDFDGLGRTIEHVVTSAVEGLEHGLNGLEEALNFDIDLEFSGHPRSVFRQKVKPGVDIRFETDQLHENEVLPNIDDVQYARQILFELEANILSKNDLISQINTSEDILNESLAKLLDLGLIIQEKTGNQRFIITKKGKRMLKASNISDEKNN